MITRSAIVLPVILVLCALTPAGRAVEVTDAEDLRSLSVRFSAAEFRQERHLKALDRPLVSSGTLTLTATGFEWRQLEPFANTLTFDGTTIVETVQTGGDTISRTIDDPMTNSVTATLFQMMSGSWAEMRAAFDVVEQTSDPDDAWAVALIPLDDNVRAVIPGIRVTGADYLERIRVEQPDGEFTLIELTNHQPLE